MSKMQHTGRVLIVEARFYPDLANEMQAGACDVLDQAEVDYDIVTVPGALEIPVAVAFARKSRKYDGYIALGCVIRGKTTHYDHVSSESIHGLQLLAVKKRLAIGIGILTVENESQAWLRAGRDKGNKGAAAAQACLHMMGLAHKLSETKK